MKTDGKRTLAMMVGYEGYGATVDAARLIGVSARTIRRAKSGGISPRLAAKINEHLTPEQRDQFIEIAREEREAREAEEASKNSSQTVDLEKLSQRLIVVRAHIDRHRPSDENLAGVVGAYLAMADAMIEGQDPAVIVDRMISTLHRIALRTELLEGTSEG